MHTYSVDELRACKYVQCNLNTSVCSVLKNSDIFRNCRARSNCNSNFYYCELLVKNINVNNYDFHLIDAVRIESEICNFFNVKCRDIFVNRYKFADDKIYSVKYFVRFDSLSEYVSFENLVLPQDWVILNRLFLYRSKCVNDGSGCVHGSVYRNELVNINIVNECDDRLVDTNIADAAQHCASVSICSDIVSISFLNAFKNNFNFFHVNIQAILDSTHFDDLCYVTLKS